MVAKFSSDRGSAVLTISAASGLRTEGYGVAVDAADKAYVTGYANALFQPRWTPFQTARSGLDAFVL